MVRRENLGILLEEVSEPIGRTRTAVQALVKRKQYIRKFITQGNKAIWDMVETQGDDLKYFVDQLEVVESSAKKVEKVVQEIIECGRDDPKTLIQLHPGGERQGMW